VEGRTSRLRRSTLTDRGMRRSNRRAMACMGHSAILRKVGWMGVGDGNDKSIIRLSAEDLADVPKWHWASIPDNPEPSQVLASRIHGSTRGLSTPPGARENIGAAQRSPIYGSLSGVVIPGFLAKR